MTDSRDRPDDQSEASESLRQAAALLEHHPVEALRTLQSVTGKDAASATFHILQARILIALERFLAAAEAARRAFELDGMSEEVLALRLHALSHGGDYAALESELGQAMTQRRHEFRNLLAMAQCARLLNQSERAVRLYELLTRHRPDDASLWARLGVIHESRGEMETAESCLREAIARDPPAAQSRYLLSCLRRQSPDDNHLPTLHQAWSEAEGRDSAHAREKACLAYALGKEHEDLEQFEPAFSWYAQGARIERSRIHHSSDEQDLLYEEISRLSLETNPGSAESHNHTAPIFIVGLPRTGSTLLDTLLTRHSRVASAGELPTFREALKAQLGNDDARGFLEQTVARDCSDLDFQQLGERYLSMARTSALSGKCFTDKMPGNHLLLGFIARALPDARLICVERDPADSCMSVFKQLFTPGSYPYSYDLAEAARHCLRHRELTRRWLTQLSGHVLKVNYEDLVTATEATMRRVLKFCGLDWEAACLDPSAGHAVINTASAAQVRQPIYRTSVGRWRKYEPQMAPALRILANEDSQTREALSPEDSS
ncbi:tetratricopeptide repeat-containing sulfotransferase family protein [Elongatibacter sediminis]|uniref:Sulfotransferase n=1 Tax=Elongatibacter sediminis TaxID=3119006 RepID=A0AAW9RI93_9GAMM